MPVAGSIVVVTAPPTPVGWAAATHWKLLPPPVSRVPVGHPQTPCVMVPPVQVMAASTSTHCRPRAFVQREQNGLVTVRGVTQFGCVPVWPAGHVVTFTGVGLGTRRRQFGGVPTSGGGHVAAVTQFGGVPVWPGAQNFLLP